MKFSVGDRVKVKRCLCRYPNACISDYHQKFIGRTLQIESTALYGEDYPYALRLEGDVARWREDELQLIKGETMQRRTFRLLKETPANDKGTLVQEMCDDGDQDYKSLTDNRFGCSSVFTREVVETQPKWFEEVFPLVPTYGTKAELEAFRKFSRKSK